MHWWLPKHKTLVINTSLFSWSRVQGLGLGFERGGTSFVILISILCVDCDQFLPVLQIYFFYIEFDPSKSGVFLLIRIFRVFFILFF